MRARLNASGWWEKFEGTARDIKNKE